MAIPRNTVNVSNNQINVVEVISFGPRGPQGSGGGNINEALTTASLAGYSLTFTKGDNSQFTLNLPQPSPTPTGEFIVSASNLRSENVIDFERQNGERFFVRIDDVENATSSSISVTANTASYVLASNIDTSVAISTLDVTNLTATNFDLDNNLTITGSLTAAAISGAIDYSYIKNVPYFVDVEGDVSPNQLAIFVDSTTGLPESLPFNLPLGSEGGNPTVKGLAGLTFDGTTFNVQGDINATGTVTGGNFDIDTLSVTSLTIDQLTGSIDYSHIENVPQFVDLSGEASTNQLAVFADSTTGLPESLPFSLPLGSDGNPSLKGLSGLTFDGSTFEVSGSLKTNGIVGVAQQTGGVKKGIYFYDPGSQDLVNEGFIRDDATYVELGYRGTSSLHVNDTTFRSTAAIHRFNAAHFRFDNLPTSDPEQAGLLFQTSSAAIGASAGFQVILISQG